MSMAIIRLCCSLSSARYRVPQYAVVVPFPTSLVTKSAERPRANFVFSQILSHLQFAEVILSYAKIFTVLLFSVIKDTERNTNSWYYKLYRRIGGRFQYSI